MRDATEQEIRSALTKIATQTSLQGRDRIIAAAASADDRSPSDRRRAKNTPRALSRPRVAMVAVAAVAAVSVPAAMTVRTASSPDDSPVTSATDQAGQDCIAGVEFEGATYIMAMGREVKTLPTTQLLGSAVMGACSDGVGRTEAGEDDRRQVDVYAVPDVPPDDAILVGGADGQGTLYLPLRGAEDVDPELAALLKKFRVAES